MSNITKIAEYDGDLSVAVQFLEEMRTDIGQDAFAFILDTLSAAAKSLVNLGGQVESEHLKAATLAQAVCLQAGLDFYRRSVAEREGME